MRNWWLCVMLIGLFLNTHIAVEASVPPTIECPSSHFSDKLAYGEALLACGDYQTALVEMSNLLATTTEPIARADIQVIIGRAALGLNDLIQAQGQFERAFLAYNAANLHQKSGIAYYLAGQAKYLRRLQDEALTYFYEGRRRAGQADDFLTQGLITRAIAVIFLERGDRRRASEEYANSYTMLLQSSNDVEKANAALTHADWLLFFGNVSEAKQVYISALTFAQLGGARSQAAQALLRLAYYDAEQLDFNNAYAKLEQAATEFASLGDDVSWARTQVRWAWTQHQEGTLLSAVERIEDSQVFNYAQQSCELLMEYFATQGHILIDMHSSNAEKALKDALQQPCAQNYPHLRSIALRGLGEYYFTRGDIVSGRDNLQFALAAARSVNYRIGERDVLISFGWNLFRRGAFFFSTGFRMFVPPRDIQMARDYLFTARNLAQQQDSLRSQVLIDIGFALIAEAERDYDKALLAYQELLERTASIGFEPLQRDLIEQIAQIYFQRGRFQQALDYFSEASIALNLQGSPYFAARELYYRGIIALQRGDFDLAVSLLERAAAQFLEINDPDNYAYALLELGNIQARLRRFDEALESFSKVEPPASITLQLRAKLYIADVELQQWDEEAARSVAVNTQARDSLFSKLEFSYLAIAQAFELTDDLAGQAEALNRLGLLGMRTTVPANFGTGGFFTSALQLSRLIGNRYLEMQTLYNLAEFNRLADPQRALIYYNDALQIANTLEPLLATVIRIKIARILENQNETQRAMRAYEAVLVEIESFYTRFIDSTDRERFGAQQLFLMPYERLIRFYGLNVINGRVRDAELALNYTERSRARSYLFQLTRDLRFEAANDDPAFTAWLNTRDDFFQLVQQQRIAGAVGDTTQLQALEVEIDAIQSELLRLYDEISTDSIRQFTGIAPATLQQIQSSLPDDTAMLIYYVSRETITRTRTEAGRVFIFVVTRDTIFQHPVRIDNYNNEIVERIDVFRRTLRTTESLRPFYNLLIRPIEREISSYSNLVIIPHDVLNYLPFEAIPGADGIPLVERYRIQYAPSATVYTILTNTVPVEGTGEVLVMSYGDDLFYAEDEAYVVAELNNSSPFVFEEATETIFRQHAGEVDLIHIAAHARFVPQNPLDSYLALAPDDENDGQLTIAEIYSLSLWERNPVVVLSACDTGVNVINPGDELQGLSRAFLLSGAQAVIASLWAVDDQVTSELMRTFYLARAEGMSNAAALTHAKRVIRRDFPEPLYWAGFIIYGG